MKKNISSKNIMNTYVFFSIVLILIAIISTFFLMKNNFFVTNNNIKYDNSYFSFNIPPHYELIEQSDGSTVIQSPVDKNKVVMDAEFRLESLRIYGDNKDWRMLHVSDINYAEPIDFRKNYFENLGWKTEMITIDNHQGFRLTRDSYDNIFIITKDQEKYILINIVPMGSQQETPGLNMVLESFKLKSI